MSEFTRYLYIYKYIYKYRNIFWLLEGILRTATTATMQRIVASLHNNVRWALVFMPFNIIYTIDNRG